MKPDELAPGAPEPEVPPSTIRDAHDRNAPEPQPAFVESAGPAAVPSQPWFSAPIEGSPEATVMPDAPYQSPEPTYREVLGADYVRGKERMGSGGFSVDASIGLREELEAEGVSQAGVAPGSIRIGDLIGPPSRFGLPDRITGSAFPDRFADSPALDQPVPAPVVNQEALDQREQQAQYQETDVFGRPLDAAADAAGRAQAGQFWDRVGGGIASTPAVKAGRATLDAIGVGLEGAQQFAKAGAAIPHIIGDAGVRARFDDLVLQIAAKTGRNATDPFVRMAAGITVQDERPDAFTVPLRNIVGAVPFLAPAKWLIPEDILVGEKGLSELAFDPFNLVGGVGFEKAVLQGLQRGAAQVPRAAWWVTQAAERSVIGRQTAGLGAGYFAKYAPTPTSAARLIKKRERELLQLGPTDPTASDVAADLRRIADENDDPILRAQYLGPDRGIKRSPTIARGQGQSDVPTRTGARPNIVGMGVSRTPEAQAYDVANVARLRQAADEMDALSDRLKQIDNDPILEWGALSPEEQIIQLLIKEPDGAWEDFLTAYRAAPTPEGQSLIVQYARDHGTNLDHVRHGTTPGDMPISTERVLLVGDTSTDTLTEQAVLAAKLNDLRVKGIAQSKTAPRVQPVPQRYTVRPKVVDGVLSKKRYEIVAPDGRVYTTVSGKTTAQQRVGELNLAAANTQLPGTPAATAPAPATAPDLVLSAQDVPLEKSGMQQGLDMGTSPQTVKGQADSTYEGMDINLATIESEQRGRWEAIQDLEDEMATTSAAGRKRILEKEIARLRDEYEGTLSEVADATSQGTANTIRAHVENGVVPDLEARTRPRTAEPGQGAAILPDSLAPTMERLVRDYDVPVKGAPQGFRIIPKDDGRKVVAAYDDNGDLVGILSTKPGNAQTVVVREDARRQGVATRLYDAARDAGIDVEANIGRGGRTQAGLDFTEAYRKKNAIDADPAMEAKLATGRSPDLTDAQRAEAAAPLPELTGAEVVWRRFQDASGGAVDSPIPTGPRYEVRGGQVFDGWTGVPDDIANAMTWGPSDPAARAATHAKWLNKRVEDGSWGEHRPRVPEGQKLVPEGAVISDAPLAQPPGQPPRKPPAKRKTAPEDEPERRADAEERDLETEGPSQVIWRVDDNVDGSSSLSKVDLERGIVIKSERFTDREGALLTAEGRNAEEDAFTMVQDVLDDLRRTLAPDEPPLLALMSPGEAAANRRGHVAMRKAEADTAARDAKAAAADVARARADYRQRVAGDPGWKVTHPGEVPPKKTRTGTTPLPGVAPSAAVTAEAAKAAARDAIGTLELLRGIRKRDAFSAFSTTSRLFGTAWDAGSIGRQMILLGARDLVTNRGRDFAPSVKALFESYLSPEVVLERAHKSYSEALSMGGGKLHYRAAGEFTGERVSDVATELVERIPLGVGESIRRSSGAFNNSINMMGSRRFVTAVKAYDAAAAKAGRPAMTQEVKDKLAWTINHSLGYAYDASNLGTKTGLVSDIASLMYSPQWQASRAAVIIDFSKALGRVVTRKADAADVESLWNGALFAAGNVATVVGVASAMGVEFEVDPRSVNFARLPLGEPGPATSVIAATLSGLGVSVNTYNDTVYADFSAGIGADFRLLAQLFPVGGDNGIMGTPFGSAKAKNATGEENDPWNPQGGRNVSDVVIDWLVSRGDPRTRGIAAGARPFKSDDRQVLERMASALISSHFPMLLQDAMESAGITENLNVETIMETIESVPSWFTPAPKPGTAPPASQIPAPAGGSLRGKYGTP